MALVRLTDERMRARAPRAPPHADREALRAKLCAALHAAVDEVADSLLPRLWELGVDDDPEAVLEEEVSSESAPGQQVASSASAPAKATDEQECAPQPAEAPSAMSALSDDELKEMLLQAKESEGTAGGLDELD